MTGRREAVQNAQIGILDELFVDNFAGAGGASVGIELAKAMRESSITAEEAAEGFEALARQIRTSETELTRGDELIGGDENEK